ncbi:DNA repair protein Mus81, putative [Paecilomyces variotii No. 5]|uniref:Crossover junction endonuclease MUS81 n=1 Tax=Byssochlamys spectabilis (strain No. 5 / NBRC 109023) TaxID=1356009 RepID=V5G400_BYSSN|nr:DNA repair protein Mus81, putative [Paecilomyces variotii No. 5]
MADACANPLLLGWIKEWLEQARERNSKGFTVYKKAYDSMKACPLVFNHPSEAQQLNGLGPKLCERLTEKLKAYCDQNGLPMPEPPHKANKRPSGENLPDTQPAKKPKKTKPYVPALRSGPYALLIGLTTLNEYSSQSMTKAQLIEAAQPYCDASFTAPPDPTKFYTAWNSMKTLIQKDLVYEHGRPLRKYALTEEGWEVAKRIKKTIETRPNKPVTSSTTFGVGQPPRNTAIPSPVPEESPDIVRLGSGSPPPSLSAVHQATGPQLTQNPSIRAPEDAQVRTVVLPPGSFTVQLVLDTREVRTSTDRDYISNELRKRGIPLQVRALELGDAIWVAKCHDPQYLSRFGEEGDEIMLDWIVERKRLDDLIGSIKDGRFREQKFRLQRSGMKNVVYLIEEFAITHDSNHPSAAKYQESVSSAIASTQVVNGYFVKKTRNIDDSIRYLARMTALLRRMYEPPSGTATGAVNPPTSLAFMSSHDISSESYLTSLNRLRAENPDTTVAVTFATFSALTSKSDVLSLRDIFLKMLMCTRGVTGEKALEIQRRWRTPREFIEAFEALDGGDPKRKQEMVSERMNTVVGRKRVAKVLSKKLSEIWGEPGSG